MSVYTDQSGGLIGRDQFILLTTEAVLANLIAFDEAGVARDEVEQVVGPDGGILLGRGVRLETPVGRRLSDGDARLLFGAYARLLEDYDEGRLAADRLAGIRERNNVAHKVGLIRQRLARAR